MARVLTRSDGSECIVIEEEDGGVKVLRLTRPAPEAIEPKRYRVKIQSKSIPIEPYRLANGKVL